MFVRRYQSRQTPKAKSTEELELEKIEQLKWEAKRKRELSKQSYKKSKKRPTPSKPVKPVKLPTEPVGFNFKTDSRLKIPLREGGEATSSTSAFPMNLRSSHKNDYNPNDPGDVSTVCVHKCMN